MDEFRMNFHPLNLDNCNEFATQYMSLKRAGRNGFLYNIRIGPNDPNDPRAITLTDIEEVSCNNGIITIKHSNGKIHSRNIRTEGTRNFTIIPFKQYRGGKRKSRKQRKSKKQRKSRKHNK